MAMADSSVQGALLSSKPEETSNLKVEIYEESKKIWKVALPSIISRVTSFGAILVTQAFIGHMSSTDLAGYALVQSISVSFVNGILIGMSSATETLCGQAFGSKQYHMMGIFLQRSWLVNLVTLTILLPVLIFATPIFKLVGQEEAIARSAGPISLWFIAYLYSTIFNYTIQMYLQAQQKNVVVAWLSVSQLVIHIPLSWFLLAFLNWGTHGAMAALCVSSWFTVFGLLVYIFGGWCSDSWKGFTFAAFKDIIPVIKLSISSGVMICLEMWYVAIVVLLYGYLKNAEVSISAASVCFNVIMWEMMIMEGVMSAAIVRVANELGRGDASAAKFSIKVIVAISCTIGLVFSAVCFIFGNKLGYLFSDDLDVVQSVADLTVELALSALLCSINPVLSGVAIGSGWQTTVAVINFICYYMIGLPIGVVLGFLIHYDMKGIWFGLLTGIVIQTFVLSFITWKKDWHQEVLKTSERLKRWNLKSSDQN